MMQQTQTSSDRARNQQGSAPQENTERAVQDAKTELEKRSPHEARELANATGDAVRDVRIDSTKGASAREVADRAAQGGVMTDVDRRLADLKVPMAQDDTYKIKDDVRRAIMDQAREVQAKETREEQMRESAKRDADKHGESVSTGFFNYSKSA
jgi:hypothetical protein